jgi:hypothetical protein
MKFSISPYRIPYRVNPENIAHWLISRFHAVFLNPCLTAIRNVTGLTMVPRNKLTDTR